MRKRVILDSKQLNILLLQNDGKHWKNPIKTIFDGKNMLEKVTGVYQSNPIKVKCAYINECQMFYRI